MCPTHSHHGPSRSPNPSSSQHTQLQSPLLNRLPAEIRNEIYNHVFTVPSSVFPADQIAPSPLSLLLTCKRIHAEANMLAFETYTFPLGPWISATYIGLRSAVSHLSAPHISAIRSLSVSSDSDAGTFLNNALLVFPSLRHFIVKSRTIGKLGAQKGQCRNVHRSAGLVYPAGVCDVAVTEDPANRAVARYAPLALTALLATVSEGVAYRWQTGDKWRTEWPQLSSAHMYAMVQCDKDGLREELVMDEDAVGVVGGVDLCDDGCGDVSWMGAVLVQEGGRRVDVQIVYCRKADERKRGNAPSKCRNISLVPGTTPAFGAVAEGAGFRYEVDEEYWEGMRQRNGDMRALCRGLWRRAMAFENESYSRLTGRRREVTDLV